MIQMQTSASADRRRLMGTILLGILGLYVLAIDQGFLLSLVHGDIAFDLNLLHEFVHDTRHTAGFPCH